MEVNWIENFFRREQKQRQEGSEKGLSNLRGASQEEGEENV